MIFNSTILWADDDAEDIEIFMHVVQKITTSFHIVDVPNGERALDLLQKFKRTGTLPSLVILDINMPNMNGKETLLKIKEDKELEELPVVMFTTSSSTMDQLFCKQYGVKLFTKPIEFPHLKDTIQQLLQFCKE